MELDAIGFELETNMSMETTKKGYRIAEVPIHYRRRAAPPRLSSLKDGSKIGKTLLRKRFR